MQDQMSALMKMVEASLGGKTAGQMQEKTLGERDLKLCKLTDEDDIEAYLTTFERMMEAYEIPKERWVFKLAPQLMGKGQQAYSAMSSEDATDYELVNLTSILRRYNINEETYRQRFRAAKRKEGRRELCGTGYEDNGCTEEMDQRMQRYLGSTGACSNGTATTNSAHGSANMGERT